MLGYVNRNMWKQVAVLAAAVLVVLTTGLPLLACPLLADSLAATHGCCPRPAPGNCPVSQSLELCPYNVTESKLGLTEGKLDGFALLPGYGVVECTARERPIPQTSAEELLRDGSDLHLRNRVLRV